MINAQNADGTLKCTRCGHSVPPPAESTSDETLIVCPACGANLGSRGDTKKEIGSARGFRIKPRLPLACFSSRRRRAIVGCEGCRA
jgi:DNA-directed RNA polymerase subunit RPC12/RpoP